MHPAIVVALSFISVLFWEHVGRHFAITFRPSVILNQVAKWLYLTFEQIGIFISSFGYVFDMFYRYAFDMTTTLSDLLMSFWNLIKTPYGLIEGYLFITFKWRLTRLFLAVLFIVGPVLAPWPFNIRLGDLEFTNTTVEFTIGCAVSLAFVLFSIWSIPAKITECMKSEEAKQLKVPVGPYRTRSSRTIDVKDS